jgi:hypothetical protein
MIMLPGSKELLTGLITVLEQHPDGLRSAEIDEKVSQLLEIPLTDLEKVRTKGRTEYQYRMAWVRTEAKNMGIILLTTSRVWQKVSQNPAHGV